MKSSSIFIFVINERAINMIMVFCTYFATDSKYQYDESYFYQQQYDEEYYVLQTKHVMSLPSILRMVILKKKGKNCRRKQTVEST